MTIVDNRDYIRVLLYSYYTTITGWGVLLNNIISHKNNSNDNKNKHTNNKTNHTKINFDKGSEDKAWQHKEFLCTMCSSLGSVGLQVFRA